MPFPGVIRSAIKLAQHYNRIIVGSDQVACVRVGEQSVLSAGSLTRCSVLLVDVRRKSTGDFLGYAMLHASPWESAKFSDNFLKAFARMGWDRDVIVEPRLFQTARNTVSDNMCSAPSDNTCSAMILKNHAATRMGIDPQSLTAMQSVGPYHDLFSTTSVVRVSKLGSISPVLSYWETLKALLFRKAAEKKAAKKVFDPRKGL